MNYIHILLKLSKNLIMTVFYHNGLLIFQTILFGLSVKTKSFHLLSISR